MIPEQREELESDLKPDKFLKPLEKQASFKAAFDFINKMNAQQRAQRTALVPRFTISDVEVKTKLQVGDILGEYGDAVIDKRDPKVTFVGSGYETSNAIFRPLHHGT